MKEAILGWVGKDLAGREPLLYPGDGSLLTIARPGSGKSRSVVLPNLIFWEGSIICVDFNAELTKATALWRQLVLKQEVWIFDPFKTVEEKYLPKF